jgi:hypothetical protein
MIKKANKKRPDRLVSVEEFDKNKVVTMSGSHVISKRGS